MKTIRLPGLARAPLTLIGSWKPIIKQADFKSPDWLMKTYYKVGRFRKPWLGHKSLLTIQNKSGQISKALSFERKIICLKLLFGKFCSLLIIMAFITDVCEFQAFLGACLSVCDWETLTSANYWRCNNFWGSLAFFENVLRFLKQGSFNPDWFR